MLKGQAGSSPSAPGMTPAECVIDVFGGIRSVARATGVAPSTVLRWGERPTGEIPREYLQQLLDAAAKRGKRLTLEELVFGRPAIARRVVTFLTPAERPDALVLMARTLTRAACSA